MGCMQSTEAAAVSSKEPSLAKMDKLTSTAYTAKAPPTHWADTVFLVPHETLRHEMEYLVKSSKALPDSPSEADAWKAELFAKWLVEYFVPFVHDHHDNEEKIYLPFMVSKGCTIPEKKISVDHGTLIKTLDEIGKTAQAILDAKGMNCSTEIKKLKTMAGPFMKDMNAHLREEETELPPQIKAKLTLEEHQELIHKIMAAGGLHGIQTELPAVLFYTKIWSSDEFYPIFEADIPPPMVKLANDVLLPNFKSYWCAMRDAPTMKEKPGLKQLPFDPSMLPPPPGAA